MPRPSIYSPEAKAAILVQAKRWMKEGMRHREMADRLQVSEASLRAWLREQTLNLLLPPLEPSQNPRARKK
jgi:transposase